MSDVPDAGPFFPGTTADLRIGDLLTAAELAAGGAEPRVHAVEPTAPSRTTRT